MRVRAVSVPAVLQQVIIHLQELCPEGLHLLPHHRPHVISPYDSAHRLRLGNRRESGHPGTYDQHLGLARTEGSITVGLADAALPAAERRADWYTVSLANRTLSRPARHLAPILLAQRRITSPYLLLRLSIYSFYNVKKYEDSDGCIVTY